MNHPIYSMFPQYPFQILTYRCMDSEEVVYWVLFHDPCLSFKVEPFDTGGYLVTEILQQQSLPEVRVENDWQLKILIEERMEEYLQEVFRDEN